MRSRERRDSDNAPDVWWFVQDHEKRIRYVEKWMFKVIGASALFAFLGSIAASIFVEFIKL